VRAVAFLAFPRLTLLDLIGPYDALRRVRSHGRDLAIELFGPADEVTDEGGLTLRCRPLGDLSAFDLLVVPGGLGVDALLSDERLVGWIRGWGEERPIASVCSGSLLLGAAGHLHGIRATTHPLRVEALRAYCEVETSQRVVDAGRVITAGGVSCGIDLGLHLVRRFFGEDLAEAIRRQMVLPDGF